MHKCVSDFVIIGLGNGLLGAKPLPYQWCLILNNRGIYFDQTQGLDMIVFIHKNASEIVN